MPGKFLGERNLEGYIPQGHKESDMTEHACMHTHRNIHTHAHSEYYSAINKNRIMPFAGKQTDLEIIILSEGRWKNII